jgi:hypothetical protein
MSVTEIDDIEKSYAKEIKAWNIQSEDSLKYVKSLSKSKEALANHYELT